MLSYGQQLDVARERHDIRWHWVKGHAGAILKMNGRMSLRARAWRRAGSDWSANS